MNAPFFFTIFYLSIFNLQADELKRLTWDKLFHIQHNQPLIQLKDFLATYKVDEKFSVEKEITYWQEKFSAFDNEIAICKFPARYWLWSKGKLKLPEKICPNLATFLSEFDIEKVFLVFSSYYPQNSASLFGHTFLRFTRFNNKGQELLDWGVSYSAETSNIDPISTIYKSFFSTFDGSMQLMPYYYKVREYNDFEFRPLWSYELKLTKPEIKFLLYHLWELAQIKIPYQYLNHNCSSLILDILAIFKPEVNFRDDMAFYHIPIDTVKVLKKHNLLLEEVHYRPSLMHEWEDNFSKLNNSEKKKLVKFLKDKDFNQIDNIVLADAALDYYDFKYGKEFITENNHDPKISEIKDEKNKLLIIRSKLPTISYEAIISKERAPDQVHPTRRMAAGFAANDKHEQRFLMNYRFAYHDPNDPTVGMTSRMKINFINPEISITDKKSLRLEKFDLIDIASWSYSPPLNYSLSYELSASWQRWIQSNEWMRGTNLLLAAGSTFDLWDGAYLAIMLEQQLTHSNDRSDAFGLKLGPQIMLHYDFQKYRFRLTSKKLYEVTGYQKNQVELDIIDTMFNMSLGNNHVLSLKFNHSNNFNESVLLWYYYY